MDPSSPSSSILITVSILLWILYGNMVDFSFIVSLYVSDLPNVTISAVRVLVLMYCTRTSAGDVRNNKEDVRNNPETDCPELRVLTGLTGNKPDCPELTVRNCPETSYEYSTSTYYRLHLTAKTNYKNRYKIDTKSIQNRYKSIQIDDKTTVPKRTKCAENSSKTQKNRSKTQKTGTSTRRSLEVISTFIST